MHKKPKFIALPSRFLNSPFTSPKIKMTPLPTYVIKKVTAGSSIKLNETPKNFPQLHSYEQKNVVHLFPYKRNP